MLIGSYNPLFVILSLLVAVLASFTALVMASRVTTAEPGRAANLWLLAGGCAMGFGIWSMHFIGMLAFRLPIPLGYDAWITLQSLLVAVAASIFALWLVSRATLPHLRLALGAILMGIGIAWMHYLGMDALRMQPGIQYHQGWFALSIIIAVVASWSALFIAFRLRARENRISTWLAAAIVMGTAIVGMHYTGMAAAGFPEDSICGAARNGGLPSEWLATFVVTLTVAILAIVLLISWLDQRMQSRLLVLRNSLLSASLDTARSELLQAALIDPLTQLPNRQALQEAIEQAVASHGAGEPRFAIMFMDLDGFRQVNDAYGHQTGDSLLVLVAEHLRQMLGPRDKVARLGGDQFVMLVAMDNEAEVINLSDRIIHAVSGIRVSGRNLRVTASIGISVFPEHADNERRLMTCADMAMYHAKNTGRNTYALFADWMDDNAEQQLHLLTDLRSAIGTPQIFLHYQPKLRAESGQVSGAEALIRWRHPVHGLIPAERIISIAENSGLIAQIGQWALNEACRQLRCWHDAGQRDWNVSVNLSPLQLPSPQLLEDVKQTLARHELSPAKLILEVTESSVMRDTEASLKLLHDLAALGVGISIDDFGTGYSSLLYLKRLPATELKIDHIFIQSLEDSDEDVVIVSAIIALAHALNLDVIAEGVETQGQRSFIERLGCDYLQGFLLGRPVNAENFIRLHAQSPRGGGGEPRRNRSAESAGHY